MPSESEPQFSAIVSGSLSAVWRNAPFLVGLGLAAWAGAFGLQVIVRLVERGGFSPGNVASVTLVASVLAMAVGAVIDAILYQRLLRLMHGEPGGFLTDIAAGLRAAPSMIGVSLPMSAPDLLASGLILGIGLLPGEAGAWAITPLAFAILAGSLLILLNWSLGPVLLLDRGMTPPDALRASQRLMRGRHWLVIRLLSVVAPVFILGALLMQVSVRVDAPGAATPAMPSPLPLIFMAQLLAVAEVANSLWRVVVFHLYAAVRALPSNEADTFE